MVFRGLKISICHETRVFTSVASALEFLDDALGEEMENGPDGSTVSIEVVDLSWAHARELHQANEGEI